jgi:ATP-dependent exoDNAse (exonuclease V) alpha subunit
VTSHSSQGQTAERVLIHVDTEQAPGELVNSRMAYVSVSRAQFDVQMYTNDAKAHGALLAQTIGRWRKTTLSVSLRSILIMAEW